MENNKKQFIDIEIVKSIMKSKGIDEKELARLMGVTVPTIKRFLGGADQRRMSGLIMIGFARALGVSAQSLLREEYR